MNSPGEAADPAFAGNKPCYPWLVVVAKEEFSPARFRWHGSRLSLRFGRGEAGLRKTCRRLLHAALPLCSVSQPPGIGCRRPDPADLFSLGLEGSSAA